MSELLSRTTILKDDYLSEIDAELDKEPEKPKKKTKAEKKAEKKEKRRLQAIDDKKLIMRDHLRRELELSKRMERRGWEEWEEMCKEIKLIELKEELLEWEEKSKRNVERKNETIESMLHNIDTTNEIHMKAYSKTLESIDYITNCFETLVQSTKQLHELQMEEMLKDFYDEVKERTEEVEAMHEQNENVVHASNLLAMDTLRLDYQIYTENRDDYVNTEIENRFAIRDQIVSKMRGMQKQLNEFVDTLRNTELDAHKYEKIRFLSERQVLFQEESIKLSVEEMKYTSMMSELQRDLLKFENDANTTINDLKLELNYFTNVRQKLENDLITDRKITHSKLCILTTECYDVIKEFEKYVKSGELLLALSATCRKLQTESEKIVLGGEINNPYDLGDVNESFVLKSLDLKKHLDMTEEELVEQNKFLYNFWRRQAMVQAQNVLLLEERRTLAAENQGYIDFIKSIHKTDVLDELSALLTVMPVKDQPKIVTDLECLKWKLAASDSKPKVDIRAPLLSLKAMSVMPELPPLISHTVLSSENIFDKKTNKMMKIDSSAAKKSAKSIKFDV